MAAREAVGLLRRERRPEVGTGAVVDDLEQGLKEPASDDDSEEEEGADAASSEEERCRDGERGRQEEPVISEK